MQLKDNNLYYVGGVVRDSILGAQSFDTDYCYEGNAIEFAKNAELNIIKENPAFGTVRVLFDEKEIDIASTRVETYPKKGHLPVIQKIGCPLCEDVKRRDFTINSIAKRTTDGEIIDFLGGLKDIKEKKLRVIHSESFIDDPTRIVRALKFSVRFGFCLDDSTKKLQEEYLNNINYDMSYHRLKKELVETFSLNRQIALEKFINDGIYRLLGENSKPPLVNRNIEELISSNPVKNVWIVYLGLFNLENIELTRTEKRIIEWAERLKSGDKPNNNTPPESILINQIQGEL